MINKGKEGIGKGMRMLDTYPVNNSSFTSHVRDISIASDIIHFLKSFFLA